MRTLRTWFAEQSSADARGPTTPRRHLRRVVRPLIAAVLLVGGLVAGHAAGLFPPSRARAFVSADAMTTVTAPLGGSKDVILPDGSQVILGPGSTLAYPPTIGTDDRRRVHLDGEAYFTVNRLPARPFLVHTNNLYADIDNQALVRAYLEDAATQVIVREGHAIVNDDKRVEPGYAARLADDGTHINVVPADTTGWFSWVHGTLVFADAFAKAIPRLNRWYDLDLRVADSALGNAILVARLPDTLSEGTLEVIGLALSARVERRGRKVTFYPLLPRR